MLEPSITGFFVSVLPILLYWMKGRHGKFTCKWLYHLPLFDEIDPKKKKYKKWNRKTKLNACRQSWENRIEQAQDDMRWITVSLNYLSKARQN